MSTQASTVFPLHSPSRDVAETILGSPQSCGWGSKGSRWGRDLPKVTGSSKVGLEFRQPDFLPKVLLIRSCINVTLMPPWNTEFANKIPSMLLKELKLHLLTHLQEADPGKHTDAQGLRICIFRDIYTPLFTWLCFPWLYACRSLILKRCVRTGVRGGGRGRKGSDCYICSMCSCEDLSNSYTCSENDPTGDLEEQNVPNNGRIQPRTRDTWKVRWGRKNIVRLVSSTSWQNCNSARRHEIVLSSRTQVCSDKYNRHICLHKEFVHGSHPPFVHPLYSPFSREGSSE